MTSLYTHIGRLSGLHTGNGPLRGKDLQQLPFLENAYLLVEDGLIAAYGRMAELELDMPVLPLVQVDLQGSWVFPAWCDSHTHLVFPQSREEEFLDKIRGMSYAEIAARGGGILNSARKLQEMPEDVLFLKAWERLQECSKNGTGAIEIKSGYGLTVASELKMLRVIKKLKEKSPVTIKSSFLAAHTYPAEYRDDHETYIGQIIEEMLPVVAGEKLADYIDVFCESGFFSPDEMEKILRAGMALGLKPKVHVNQLNSIGGLQRAIALQALSVDHLETMTEQDILDLAASDCVGTLLPTAAYFLRMTFQPARAMADAGAILALASDFNPGSSPSSNMSLVMSMACIQMKMLPEEAINAATINGAAAMELQEILGSITPGKKANLIITKPMPSLAYWPYAFGSNQVQQVMLEGVFV